MLRVPDVAGLWRCSRRSGHVAETNMSQFPQEGPAQPLGGRCTSVDYGEGLLFWWQYEEKGAALLPQPARIQMFVFDDPVGGNDPDSQPFEEEKGIDGQPADIRFADQLPGGFQDDSGSFLHHVAATPLFLFIVQGMLRREKGSPEYGPPQGGAAPRSLRVEADQDAPKNTP